MPTGEFASRTFESLTCDTRPSARSPTRGSRPSCDANRGTKSSARLARRTSCPGDRKSTRLNSSHLVISYAVFCLKKKKTFKDTHPLVGHDSQYLVAVS